MCLFASPCWGFCLASKFLQPCLGLDVAPAPPCGGNRLRCSFGYSLHLAYPNRHLGRRTPFRSRTQLGCIDRSSSSHNKNHIMQEKDHASPAKKLAVQMVPMRTKPTETDSDPHHLQWSGKPQWHVRGLGFQNQAPSSGVPAHSYPSSKNGGGYNIP
jgi:hypothetical protein